MSTGSAPVHNLKVLALVAATTCLVAPAAVQAQQVVGVSGEAENLCTLGAATLGDGALTNFDTPSGSVFAISELSNPATLSTRAAYVTLSLEATCTGIHRVILASDNNGLWRQGVTNTPVGFGSAVPYTANLLWADEQHLLTAEASFRQQEQRQILVGRPNTGEMLIEFAINVGATNAGSGAPLLAGEYSDVLRVTMEPQ